MGNKYFDEVKKNFGFGCMRLPMNGEQVDYEETCKMVGQKDTLNVLARVVSN